MGVTVHFQKLSHFGDLELPGYATDQSAGMDLRAAVAEPVILNPGDRRVIPCGFSMELPAGFEAQVRPRSGLAAKNGVTVLNAPGTIDADYRGEVMVILVNHGQESFTVHRGDWRRSCAGLRPRPALGDAKCRAKQCLRTLHVGLVLRAW